MPLGFYVIMAAQFCSALADNALLIVAISLLRDMGAATEIEPLLKLVFALSYVVLAAFVGAFADSMAKGRVMLISNTIKIGGCLLLLLGAHPLIAYTVVGLGAAAYSPAKYGILTEYLPHRLLVVANGWIEGLTVGAIIAGTLVGGLLVAPAAIELSTRFGLHHIHVMVGLVTLIYGLAALFNMFIPDTGVDHKLFTSSPLRLLRDFAHCVRLLWRDPLGQVALAVTTLFWGAGATLQFIVIKWAEHQLGFDLSQAAVMQGVVAIGVAAGSIAAARLISLRQTTRVLPVGIAMGFVVMLMVFVYSFISALLMMIIVGALAGFFVVPMNALLQHRGHMLMGAGHSIAVQNFNENLSILVMTGLYALLIALDVSINTVICLFGGFVALTMFFIKLRFESNQRRDNALARLDRH